MAIDFQIPPHMPLSEDTTEDVLRARTQWKMQFERVNSEINKAASLLGTRPILHESDTSKRLSPTEVAAQRRLLRRYGRSLRSIAKHSTDARADRVVREVAVTLRTAAARASVLILDAHASRRVLQMARVEERVAMLDLCRPCNDRVTWKGEPKDNGCTRPAISFGWRHRAQQAALRDVLLASGVWNPYEFSSAGKGPHAFVRRIIAAIEAGYRYWVVADIKNCFASVRLEHLHGLLPLKRSAAWRGMIFLPKETLVSGIPETLEGAARGGLPMGSLVSPRLASALIGREIRAAMSGSQGLAMSFADDTAIGARSLKEAEAIKDALCDRLASLNPGPLTFKYIKVTSAVDGIDIVGRRIRLKWWVDEWKVRVQPSPRSFKRLAYKARKEFGDIALLGETDMVLLRDYIRRWATAHDWALQPGWDDVVIDHCLNDPHELGLAELAKLG